MGKNTTTYIIIAVLVLAGAYWAYSKYSNPVVVPTGGVTVTSSDGTAIPTDKVTKQANDFIQILQNIRGVKLENLSLLSDPVFKEQLQDFGKPVEDKPKGRTNPFAPISAANDAVKKTATNNQATSGAGAVSNPSGGDNSGTADTETGSGGSAGASLLDSLAE